MMPYERFDAWQVCHKLVLEVYRSTKDFPGSERYGLRSQARRAAFSAAANIAEGSAKHGVREFRRYLDISIGSLSELAYALRDTGMIRIVAGASPGETTHYRLGVDVSDLSTVTVPGTIQAVITSRIDRLPPLWALDTGPGRVILGFSL